MSAMSQPYSLTGKIALITGGSVGIGEATALALASQGCNLILTYRTHPNEADLVAEECRKLGGAKVMTIKLDVASDDSIRQVVDEVVKEFGQIDILINNAGIVLWKHFADLTWQEIEDQLRINLEGLIKMTKAALPHIRDSIINLSSVGGLEGFKTVTVYCGTKFGIRGFSQALAKELPNIRVFSVNPNGMATQMNDFKGLPPSVTADAIVDTLLGRNNVKSGGDVNVGYPFSPQALRMAKDLIRPVQNFPHPGITFQDLTPLLADGSAFHAVVNDLRPHAMDVDVIVGIEARGFIFAAALAHSLSLGFIPIRKKGKLPFATHDEKYGLEYGEDIVQVHQDAFAAGTKVLLIDDVLATGGTMIAGIRLLERLGGRVIGVGTVLEISSLGGRNRIAGSYPDLPIHSVFTI
jgi:adenine phosphoribosyltransferase